MTGLNGAPDTAMLVREILRGYRLPVRGTHGVVHWARVLENGLRVAELNGADTRVVTLFALFHDSRRVKKAAIADMGGAVPSSPAQCATSSISMTSPSRF